MVANKQKKNSVKDTIHGVTQGLQPLLVFSIGYGCKKIQKNQSFKSHH